MTNIFYLIGIGIIPIPSPKEKGASVHVIGLIPFPSPKGRRVPLFIFDYFICAYCDNKFVLNLSNVDINKESYGGAPSPSGEGWGEVNVLIPFPSPKEKGASVYL
ncbi:MAG: hypothetical protein QM726_13150 [Chitinophagaceae bacterium]